MLKGAEKVPMQQDDTGVWTFTTDSLEPDLYSYSFLADSANLIDPGKTRIKPNLLNLSNIVRLPGKTPLTCEVQDVPHGEIQGISRNTRSSICCTASGMMPAAVGQANVILDSLIAHVSQTNDRRDGRLATARRESSPMDSKGLSTTSCARKPSTSFAARN